MARKIVTVDELFNLPPEVRTRMGAVFALRTELPALVNQYTAQYLAANGGGGGGGASAESPVVLSQKAKNETALTIHRLFGTSDSTTDANLMEVRNAKESGTPGLGQLVFYINEEGYPRIQNALDSKTLFRIRNWGTDVNAFQLTNSDGTEILFNLNASTGVITAPNIGEPIRGVLNAGQQPAPGSIEGIYLRRTV